MVIIIVVVVIMFPLIDWFFLGRDEHRLLIVDLGCPLSWRGNDLTSDLHRGLHDGDWQLHSLAVALRVARLVLHTDHQEVFNLHEFALKAAREGIEHGFL